MAAKADRYQDMQQRVAKITETATSPDGMVWVTVASSGIITGLQLADRSVERGAQRLAAEVLETMRRAQSRLSRRVAEVMAASRPTCEDPPRPASRRSDLARSKRLDRPQICSVRTPKDAIKGFGAAPRPA